MNPLGINRNISVRNLMTKMINAMDKESNLEIETIVIRVDDADYDETFINDIFEKDGKIVFRVYDYKKGDSE